MYFIPTIFLERNKMMSYPNWLYTSVGYEIYPRSFYDSNQDGVGDIRGIIEKIDYLKHLGINLLWVGPFYPSPLDDNGYDVIDHRDVDDRLGTLDDIKELIDECHKRDIKIIFDYIMTQTSDEHPWFIESRQSVTSKNREYYIWSKEPNNWGSLFGGSAWNYDETSNEYYLKIFSDKMPDLNWSNPKVRSEMFALAKYWLDLGADGFRMDAIAHLGKDMTLTHSRKKLDEDGIAPDWSKFSNRDALYDYLEELKTKVFDRYDMVSIGEVGGGAKLRDAYKYTKTIDMVFNFDACWCLDENKQTDVLELKQVINYWITGMKNKGYLLPQYWLNHDHPRVMSQYGDENNPKVSGKMLATILLFLYGVPFIYNGEEIGMTNAKYTKIEDFKDVSSQNYIRLNKHRKTEKEILNHLLFNSRDHGHLPMQWSATKYAGFSTTTPYLKVNSDYKTVNVEDQLKDEDSLLNFYRQAINLRINSEYTNTFIHGDFKLIEEKSKSIFGYIREDDNYTITILANMKNKKVTYKEQDSEIILSNLKTHTANELQPYESIVMVNKK